MAGMVLNPRQMVALYLHLVQNGQSNPPELSAVQEIVSRELCKYLSIAQFEQLQSLYESGYQFEEILE